jgi:hypothetical protein
MLLMVLAIAAGSSKQAKACSCQEPKPPPCETYWAAAAVFTGKVVSLTSIPIKEDGYDTHQTRAHFLIEKAFRGIESTEVDLFMGASNCSYGFTKGETYLVYAYRNEKTKQLSTSICTRTGLVAGAFEDLQYIEGLSSAAAGARIYGQVSKYKITDGRSDFDPLTKIKIIARSSEKQYEAASDDKGQFSITGLPEGSYKISVELPAGLVAPYLDREVQVAARGCAMLHILVETDGRLSGKIFDFRGQPLANAALYLLPIDPAQRSQGGSAYSTPEGVYEFKRLSPGLYRMLIRFDGQLTDQHRPFPLLYYPGVSDINQATVFKIGEGERLENYDLKMPLPLKERTITGMLTWSDGRPATDVSFGYKVSEHGLLYPIKVDDQGRFTFKVYEGLEILLQANYEKGKGNYIYSPPVKASTTTEDEFIKVQLPEK